jgi:nondiscriminating aspartyl-tRNA synthetase
MFLRKTVGRLGAAFGLAIRGNYLGRKEFLLNHRRILRQMSEHKEKEVIEKKHEDEDSKSEDEKGAEGDNKLSREELKKIKEEKKKQAKLEKEAKKAEKVKAAEKPSSKAIKLVPYVTEEPYGDCEMIQSLTNHKYSFTEVGELDNSFVGKHVRVRARVHTSRVQGNLAFVTLRKGMFSCQAIAAKSDAIPKEMIKYIESVPRESVVDIEGEVTAAKEEVHGTTQKTIELQIKKFYVIGRAEELPFILEDACRKLEEGEDEEAIQAEKPADEKTVKLPVVSLTTRLDHRTLDLRVPAHVAIFRIQSETGALFREYLSKQGFIEIHSPKILGGSSEGGSEVFRLQYFNQPASLAQSPQLFKQMAILAEFGKVFEIGPVFRAENSNTPRHLCEFTGLDFEMEIKESYMEIVDTIGELFNHIFRGLNERCKKELEVVCKQYPFKPFEWSDKFLALTFEEACKLLKEHKNIDQPLDKDFTTKAEHELGVIVKEKYKTDFYIVHKYPESARPFYTMPHAEKGWTCSYDVFMRGTEIISGAQRCHDVNLLTQRVKNFGIEPSSIKYYLDSFKYGAIPHGGVGVGLERVVKLFLDINNIRKASLFPRDPTRLTP